MTEAEPEQVELRAIDIIPYRFGIWCTIEKGEPFVNPIVLRNWSEDGEHIWFMLDSHNFYKAEPDAVVKVVPIDCRHEHSDPKQSDTVVFLAKRPKPPPPKCPHCGGTGTVPLSTA